MKFLGVREAGLGNYEAFCLRHGEEVRLGTFHDVHEAAGSHDLAAIKLALDEGVDVGQLVLNDPDLSRWTPPLLSELRAYAWSDFVRDLQPVIEVRGKTLGALSLPTHAS